MTKLKNEVKKREEEKNCQILAASMFLFSIKIVPFSKFFEEKKMDSIEKKLYKNIVLYLKIELRTRES